MRTMTHLSIAFAIALAGCTGSPEELGTDIDSEYQPDAGVPAPDDNSDSGTDALDGATPDAAVAAVATDRFGVRKIYPSVGREWFLPTAADVATSEWNPNGGSRGRMVKTSEAGVFRVRGGPRLMVSSPTGKQWFRNVEVTAYYRYRASLPAAEQLSPLDTFDMQILVRGEKHRSETTVAAAAINGGVAPPTGTAAGPGYPFRSGTVNSHCLAASYHGFVDINGAMRFKKEITHTEGYTGERGRVQFPGGSIPRRWFGYKLVVRNQGGNVHMEAWLDANADGNWRKVSTAVDSGGWLGGDLDGCDAAPFRYTSDQKITWAGPAVLFRFDNIETDVKWLSVREVAPL